MRNMRLSLRNFPIGTCDSVDLGPDAEFGNARMGVLMGTASSYGVLVHIHLLLLYYVVGNDIENRNVSFTGLVNSGLCLCLPFFLFCLHCGDLHRNRIWLRPESGKPSALREDAFPGQMMY